MTEENKLSNQEDFEYFEEMHLEDFQEYEDLFKVVQEYKQGKIEKEELKDSLFGLRFRHLKDEDLDRIINETEFTTKEGNISLFNCIIFLKKMIDAGTKEKFRRIVTSDGNGLFRTPLCSGLKSRPYWLKEANRFAKIINKILKDDPDCQNKLPINEKNDELFQKLKDGVILYKLINLAQEGAISQEEIKLNPDIKPREKYENLLKVIEGAKNIGCISECTADDIADGKKPEVEDLLGEILARCNCTKKSILDNKKSDKLLNEGETRNDLANLPVDDFLKRWVNKYLSDAGHSNPLNNFGSDVKDSEKYTILLNQIDPNNCDKSALEEENLNIRAQKVIDNGKKIGADTEANPDDIALGDECLNRLFTSCLYHAVIANADEDIDIEEMKAYVKTINKLLAYDVDCTDKIKIDPESEDEVFEKLKDGIILFKLIDLADRKAINDEEIKNNNNDLSDDDKTNNLIKDVEGAHKIGCRAETKAEDIFKGKKKKGKDLIEEILGKINAPPGLVESHPDSNNLLKEGEQKEDLAKISNDDFLKRWFNSHLQSENYPNLIENFGEDCKDGEKYVILLNNLSPKKCDKSAIEIQDPVQRYEKILEDAKKALGIDTALTPQDLTLGNDGINRLFTGQIYNAFANPYCIGEKECYVKIINKLLANDTELKNILPINHETNDIFSIMKDGAILGKLLNVVVPGTIDDRVLFKGKGLTNEQKKTNLNLIINASKALGISIECTNDEILDEVRSKDIDLLYQLIKTILLTKVKIQDFPQLLRLKEKEDDEEMLLLGPEDLLLRWVNYHLLKANSQINKLTNFGNELADSEKYTILLNQIDSSKCDKSALDETDINKRAEKVISNANNIGADVQIVSNDIPTGNEHLNTVFISEIFMGNHGLGEATPEEKMIANKIYSDDAEGEREEKMYRNWINSLKLPDVKKVNNLYEECRSAILLLKVIDKVKPGTVIWKNVELHTKNPIKVGVNCDEAIHACKRSEYKIIGINGSDIRQGNKKLILAIVWQIMRAHTLQIIGGKPEAELIEWANSRVSESNKISNLKEKKLNSGVFWIDLLASIEPRVIRWDLVVKENLTDKDREMNAKYAISVARGLGACIFIVWEDVTEVKGKLLLTFLASIYDVAKARGKA